MRGVHRGWRAVAQLPVARLGYMSVCACARECACVHGRFGVWGWGGWRDHACTAARNSATCPVSPASVNVCPATSDCAERAQACQWARGACVCA